MQRTNNREYVNLASSKKIMNKEPILEKYVEHVSKECT